MSTTGETRSWFGPVYSASISKDLPCGYMVVEIGKSEAPDRSM